MAKAGIVYLGTEAGLVTLSDPGGTGRWRVTGRSLEGQPVRTLVATNALDVLVATPGKGLQRSLDGGMTWQQVLDEQVFAVAVHPARSDILYAVTAQGEMRHSSDGGASWQVAASSLNENRALFRAYALTIPNGDSAASARVVVGLGDQLWLNEDGGLAWLRHGTPLPSQMTGLWISPQRAHLVFATAGGKLYQTALGESWRQSAPTPEFCTGALALLGGKQEVLLAAQADDDDHAAFIRSEDDGQSWELATIANGDDESHTHTLKEGNITVLKPVDYHPDVTWAGTEAGQVFRSDDRGRTWHLVLSGLAPIRTLVATRLA
jgi:photosystem II stability/assembly factor-like uncharacterized protein